MKIELKERTERHVRIYYEKVQDPDIRKTLPQTVETLEQALVNFRNTLQPNATSYGKTVYVDEIYAGDIWCYGISPHETPQAMVSYCLFEKMLWGNGVMSIALMQFLDDIAQRYSLTSIGAFTYSSNQASIRVLVKNGFIEKETFVEDGAESKYFQLEVTDCHTSASTGSQ